MFKDLGDGVTMPVLGLGVWEIPDGPQCEQAVEWALEAGYRHIDTAAYYRNERSVGAALARSGLPRTDVFVTTKWMPLGRGASSEIVRSLDRLGLEFVDLYLIHWPVPFRSGRGWHEFEEIRERGLARAIGVSNYGIERLEDTIAGAKQPPAVNQVHFSPFNRSLELLEACDRLGVVLEAYSPLERGRGLDNAAITGIAERVARTPAQVMLRWAVQHGAVVIPKSSHRDRIISNAELFDFELEEADMLAIDALG